MMKCNPLNKILILINDSTYAYNLRGAIINRLIQMGKSVTVVGQKLQHADKLKAMGCNLIAVNFVRHRTNPFDDIKLFYTYKAILKQEKPDIVLSYNIKPNIYGGIACQQLGIPYISNITGLGTPLEKPSMLQKLIIYLYGKGISGARCVFFQNDENKQFFISHNMLKKTVKTQVLPGSGVDLNLYKYICFPEEKRIHILFVARIMKEKGIDLFLAAAHRFASENVIFDVCGQCEDSLYQSILENDPCVHYHGFQKDLRPFYSQCSCLLYPSSYLEGMSNVLLEAAATGRPVITTDQAGCREVVDNNKTGYLIPKQDEAALLQAVEKFLSLTTEQKRNMGLAGRKKIETEFDREIVVQAYIDCINEVI